MVRFGSLGEKKTPPSINMVINYIISIGVLLFHSTTTTNNVNCKINDF